MGASQSLPSFIFPEMSETDLKSFVNSLNSSKMNLDLKYERTLGKGRVSWSMLVRRPNNNGLLLMRLYAKRSNGKLSGRKRSSSISTINVDPLAATKLSFIHELYYEKCSQFDFVLKPILINDSDDFLVMIRPFSRYNLPDRLATESLEWEDLVWIAEQLIECFIKLHGLRAFHGDFGSGKVFLTSQNKVTIGDFAPIKPFGLQSKQQNPIEFYQIWFDEGLDGESNEIGKGCYLAPERLKFNPSESFEAADLFSLGCVLMELFTSRGFLQFKDTLKLSNAKDKEDYDRLLAGHINHGVTCTPIVDLVKRLCSFNPMERSLTFDDLEMIKSLADPKIRKWRNSINLYKTSESFYSKKMAISQFPKEIHDHESLILLILKEKDEILKSLLFKYLLEHEGNNVKALYDAMKDDQSIQNIIRDYYPYENIDNNITELIKGLRFGNRDLITKEKDLKEVINVLDHLELPVEKVKGILNKLLQIYRSRDIKDVDFENILIFEYLKIKAEEEEIDNLYKTFKINRDLLVPTSLSRVAYQLDLEKNKVPIIRSSKELDKKIKNKKDDNLNLRSLPIARLKQRLLLKFKVNENVIGILQSPDKSYFICYTTETLIFWDFKVLLRGRGLTTEPIATVNPRSEAVINTIIYGDDPDTILISFKDGIIGLYKVNFKGGNIEFSIKESFGPFNCDNLLMMIMCKRGRVLLVIEKFNIYGISPEDGEVLFEIRVNFDIKSVIDIIEGCLLCIDSKGNFRLIEIFYETGVNLVTWHLKSEDNWTLEEATVHKLSFSGKFNLIIKIRCDTVGKVILVYSIDAQSEIVSCTFRHWILEEGHFSDKNLPVINCVRGVNDDDRDLRIDIKFPSLIGFNEEIIEVSDGILRLIDFNSISSMNSTSILYPPTYKPALKLRNKRSLGIPEIVEKSEDNFIIKSSNLIGKLITIDYKNIIITAIIDKTILLYC